MSGFANELVASMKREIGASASSVITGRFSRIPAVVM